MVRISDILKNNYNPEPDDSDKDRSKEELKGSDVDNKDPGQEAVDKDSNHDPGLSSVAKAMNQKDTSDSGGPEPVEDMQIMKAMKDMEPQEEHYKKLYDLGVYLNKEAINNLLLGKKVDIERIRGWISDVVDINAMGNTDLLNYFYDTNEGSYLSSHMVNVVIMAVQIGLGSGYNKSRLNELGLAAFFFDIGMVKVEEIASLPRSLTKEEFDQIKQHTKIGEDMISSIAGLPRSIALVAREHHERVNGKGYPAGCKGIEAVNDFSRIIGMVDVYEALTHSRGHRKKNTPHEAMREILTGFCSFFDPYVLRILVDRVGIYPIGSWVELSTFAIGKVIAVNSKFPLRPVVKLILDASKNRLEEPKIINLAKQVNLFIKGPLSDKEISELSEMIR